MPTPTRDVSLALFCPFADGVGSQSQTVPLVDFDAEHHTATATWAIDLNTQPTLIEATVDSTGLVKVKTIAPRGSIGSAIVKVRDGRTLVDGSPTPRFVINVSLNTHPDTSGPELAPAGVGPVVDEDPQIGA